MKPKLVFAILAGLVICLIFSPSRGADKFYYGTYNRWWIGDFSAHYDSMRNSLRFNIVEDIDSSSAHIQALADNSLRTIVEGTGESSPTHWSYVSHYTLWEAEGLEGSYYKLSYNGGTEVDDPYASGGKARKFTGPGIPDIIQWGPSYEQEDSLGGLAIEYTAEFRLKFLYSLYQPRGAMGGGSSTRVCCIMVVDRGTILMADTLFKSEFPTNGSYKTFSLPDYTVSDNNRIEFKIYWFAPSEAIDFRVDYVKVYDDYGRQLVDLKQHDEDIMDYVSQSWVHTTIPATGETVVYRWYLRDEPKHIDSFEPARYIDSLLQAVSLERVGNQAFDHYRQDTVEHEYLLRQDPQEYHVDIFPTWCCWGPDSSGQSFQEGVRYFADLLNTCKNEAESREKDLWVTVQTFLEGWRVASCDSCAYYCHQYNNQWYCSRISRLPTPNEVRLETFLASCYGADAILNFCYYSGIDSISHPERPNLWLGLYDHMADSATGMWREIKNFTGSRARVLGQTIKQLQWLGACSDDSVGSFTLRDARQSYIYNIVPQSHFPPHVQVGFFKFGIYDYFMLVNRRCLASEGDTFRVYIAPRGDTIWAIQDMYDGSSDEIPHCYYHSEFNDVFSVFLRPGEGRLFWMFPSGQMGPTIFVPQQCSTIQAGIDQADSYRRVVLVDTGTYRENINFKGKSILVTSKFHTTGDTSYISRTIIDGSNPQKPESASVVRFVSGESRCACIKGFTLRYGHGTISHTEGPTGRWGGGIVCCNSSPTIANNIIISDSAGFGGGIFGDANSSPKIINNIIKGNRAGYGGGIYGVVQPGMIIANNLIISDTASFYGGGIGGAFGIITNNTIDGNYAYWGGGGIEVAGTTCRIVNNIITNSKDGGGIYFSVYPDSTISYNNVWNNTDGNFLGYDDWGDTTTGIRNRNNIPCDSFYNIIRDPKFVEGYHLDDSSACIDAGDNQAPGLPAFDFDGNIRVMDEQGNDTFFVDMGAYEYPPGGFGGFGKIVSGGKDTENKSSGEIPDKFSLLQNYPNPFNPTTIIKFKIQDSKFKVPIHTTLKIYNILGQLVRVLVDEEKPTGIYQAIWDGKDAEGEDVASGIYFYRFQAGEFNEVRKMVLMK